MKKNLSVIAAIIIFALSLTACGNKVLDEAKKVVDTYNVQMTAFNEQIAPYNEAVYAIESKNDELMTAIKAAQDSLNKGEVPYNEETAVTLKKAVDIATDIKVSVPEAIAEYEVRTVDEKLKQTEYQLLIEEVTADMKNMKSFIIPNVPEIPDYKDTINDVMTTLQEYENSIQGLKQVTAPSDEFVMECLQTIESITAMEAVKEEHDPNGYLNKQGGYIGCIYFTDNQVNKANLYIESGKDGIIDVGCDGGGAIEIYKTVEEAEERNTYLGSFDGTTFSSGSHYVVGTIVIRTSDELTGTQQLDLTDKITQAFLEVK